MVASHPHFVQGLTPNATPTLPHVVEVDSNGVDGCTVVFTNDMTVQTWNDGDLQFSDDGVTWYDATNPLPIMNNVIWDCLGSPFPVTTGTHWQFQSTPIPLDPPLAGLML